MLDYAKTWLALRGLTFAKDNRGVTALEYGLIAALMAVVIIGAFTTLSGDLKGAIDGISNALSANTPT
ncbi:Flp family type IVb pilin [Acidiphilium cryptum]|uniref:Flp/Fap pilin component n=1 Tax=Acidiphilium cryptum (strain JF-5) TaxID=349163 RepID=A5G039_ACICJ|nr:Flp family type IVb pilin [Acidiphilium cryptum]ABQ31221.1 Flp/Fap pilin component [Acidiphilium cryptum JF-5]